MKKGRVQSRALGKGSESFRILPLKHKEQRCSEHKQYCGCADHQLGMQRPHSPVEFVNSELSQHRETNSTKYDCETYSDAEEPVVREY